MNPISESPVFPIKTLIVDDTSLMRRAIQQIIEKDERIEVVGTAANGQQCIERIPLLKPDVITLDIDMPVMNGITTVKHIMIRHQVPIVIVSSLIQDGYFAFEALRLGVVDFIPKPSRVSVDDWGQQEETLRQRVILGASMQIHRMRRVRRRRVTGALEAFSQNTPSSVVVMGTTLAGPNSVMRIVASLPPNFPGSIIAIQEIHPKILAPFSSCFNEISPLEVLPVTETCPLRQGKVYMASILNGLILDEDPDNHGEFLLRVTEPGDSPMNQLFTSAARHFKNRSCGVLLTGTGMDGTEGMEHIKTKGGLTIGQEQDCCVYPNLVEHAVRYNVLDVLIPDHLISPFLVSWVEAGTERMKGATLHDILTDLPNRHLFMDRMNQALARAHRNQKKIAVMYIGLECFREINESLGQQTCDAVLKEIARRLKNCVRAVDTVARMAGDEFAVILEEFGNPEDAGRVALRTLKGLNDSFYVERQECAIDANIGISIYPSDGASVDVLLKNAHTAMLRVKNGDKNTYLFYRSDMEA